MMNVLTLENVNVKIGPPSVTLEDLRVWAFTPVFVLLEPDLRFPFTGYINLTGTVMLACPYWDGIPHMGMWHQYEPKGELLFKENQVYVLTREVLYPE